MANQLSARELQELKKLYQDIDGLTQSQAESMANQVQQIGNAKSELNRLRTEYNKLTSDISDTLSIFQKITQEISNQNIGINNTKKGYRGLTSIAEKIQYYQKEIVNLSSKEVKKLQEKVKQEVLRLKNTQELLEADKISLENKKQQNEFDQNRLKNIIRVAQLNNQNANNEIYKLRKLESEHIKIENKLKDIDVAYDNNLGIIEGQDEAIRNLNNTLERTLNETQSIEKTMGATGALMKGVSKIPFLKDMPGISDITSDVENDIRSIYNTTGKNVSKTEAMGMAFKKMGPAIKGGLTDPLSVAIFLFIQIKEAFKAIDDGAGELAKSMNITYSEALAFREELSSIASQSDSIFVTTKALAESYSAISNSLGANVKISAEELEIFTQLREQAGFTNDELVSINKISAATGETIKSTSVNFLGGAKALALQKGLSINVKQLMKETANTSNAIKLSIGGGAEGLAKAAIKAKEFGINLDQADKIASSLLDFESSISAELEAELLTGKQLNLETARYAALQGDIGTMAEEINKQIGGSAEFAKMNRIQQEAYAKSVGMSREELANALVEQEALTRMGRALNSEEKKAYEFAKQKYGEKEAAAMLGRGELETMKQQQSVQERFNAAVEKLKDIFVSIMDGPIGMILDALATMLSNVTAISAVLGGIIGFMLGGPIGALIGATAGGAYGAIKTSGTTNVPQNSRYLKDGAINSDGSLMVIGAKGQYSLDKDDKIFASPNINKGGNTTSIPIDYDKLAAAIAKIQINTSVKINDREIAQATNDRNLKSSVQIQ